jgi:two-component system OmpR family response regulator
MRVLVVEDEPKMAAALRQGLCAEGYAVDVADEGDGALSMASEYDYDTVVLDVMLPGRDGFSVCRTLRDRGRWMPVLMLTARGEIHSRVAGLDSGADDYLMKPFDFDELLARLRALVRRGARERPAQVVVGDLLLDPATHEVVQAGRPVELTAREFSLLELLMRRAGQVVTRTDILEHVWDYSYDGLSNVVDVYMGRLRRKLERPFGRRLIRTIRGVGYVLDST